MGTTARLDRVLLTLTGLLLAAAGVLGLLAGAGVFGSRTSRRPVFSNPVSRYVGHHGAWIWPLIALAGLLLGYLALRWLIGQLRPTGVGDLELEPSSTTGHTDLVGAAITDAVRDEISTYRGVTSTSVRLTGDQNDPHLQARVQLDARADIAAVRRRIESEALAHARQAMDRADLPVQLDLITTDKKATRVT